MSMTEIETEEYVPATIAFKMLGISRELLVKLAERRVIGTRQIPGTARRYKLADVRRVIAEAERPALTGSR